MSGINNLIMAGAVATAIAAISFLVNKIFKLVQTSTRFLDDWYGSEEKPGVIERLAEGNARFDYLEGELKVIKEELFNNHGSSLRDAIDRIEKAVSKDKE